MKARGVWELSTPRLEDLRELLDHTNATVTETLLQYAGFDAPSTAMLVGMSATHAGLLVRAVLGERAAMPRPQLELVWSGPEPADAHARDTSEVLRELFERAKRRVLIAGFAFYGANAIFETLYRRAKARALAIEFFIHIDPSGRSYPMTPVAFFTHTWPWKDVEVDVFYDARSDADVEQGSMHAKCVVVDEAATFITSANFTSAAQERNVELGVLLRDAPFARQVAAQWRALATHGMFLPLR